MQCVDALISIRAVLFPTRAGAAANENLIVFKAGPVITYYDNEKVCAADGALYMTRVNSFFVVVPLDSITVIYLPIVGELLKGNLDIDATPGKE